MSDSVTITDIRKNKSITKTDIVDTANRIVVGLKDGETDILESFIRLRALSDVLKDVQDQIKEYALEEAGKYETRSNLLGVEFDIVNGRRMYKFDDAKLKALKEAVKERETMLKGLKEPVADMNTGELIQPAEVSYTKETIRLKFNS